MSKLKELPFDSFFPSVNRLLLHLSIWVEGECVSLWIVFSYPPSCFASWMLSLYLVKIRRYALSLQKRDENTIYVLYWGLENNFTPLMCHLFMLFHGLIYSAGIWQLMCVMFSLCLDIMSFSKRTPQKIRFCSIKIQFELASNFIFFRRDIKEVFCIFTCLQMKLKSP